MSTLDFPCLILKLRFTTCRPVDTSVAIQIAACWGVFSPFTNMCLSITANFIPTGNYFEAFLFGAVHIVECFTNQPNVFEHSNLI